MRRQSGTSSLRAIVYMDEIAGYFPPVANPPSKAPLLTLLKQARAFGIGIVLATQNTVDLDYKGLGNAGTWFLGRLQTERDKARVLDGLEGAAAGGLDRAAADKTLSALGKRVFLLHDVHAGAPITFQSRWAMSYLRGPLSREQIKALMAASSQPAAGLRAPRIRPTAAAAGNRRHGLSGRAPRRPRRRRCSRRTSSSSSFRRRRRSALHAGRARRCARDVRRRQAEDQRDTRRRRRRADRRRGGAGGLGGGRDPRHRAGRSRDGAGRGRDLRRRCPRRPPRRRATPRGRKSFAAWLARSQKLELHRARRAQADVERRGVGARLPHPRAERAARGARRRGRRRAAEVRREARAARREAAPRRAGRPARAGAGVAGEAAERRSRWRATVLRRAARAQVDQHQHARTRHDRGPRRRPRVEGAGRRQARAGERRRVEEGARGARREDRRRDRRDRRAIRRGRRSLETVSLAPKRGQVLVQSVALGWKAES